jgi:ankyrin repeat protein
MISTNLCLSHSHSLTLSLSLSLTHSLTHSLSLSVCVCSDIAMAKALVLAGAELHAVDAQGWSALHIAVQQDKPAFVEAILLTEADPDFTVNTVTALHVAAALDRFSCAQFLLENGASTTKADSSGWTALHHASSKGANRVLPLLLEAGANTELETTDESPRTALQLAVEYGHDSTVAILSRWGASLKRLNVDLWLERHSLDQYKSLFHENKIASDLLPALTREFLRDQLGITKAGDLLRFEIAVSKLKPKDEL